MPVERIAESLAYINWTVLTALATGTFAAVVAGRFATEATRGYLGFTAFSAAAFAVLAALSDGGLAGGARPPGPAIAPADAAWNTLRAGGLWALAGIAALYGLFLRRGRPAPPVAVLGLGASLLTLVAAAVSWSPDGTILGSAVLLVQLLGLAAALGGVWAAMVLGHWYLVTPKLPEAPLIRFARWLTLVLAAQLVLAVAWIGLGAGSAGLPAFAALTTLPWALFVWLRVLVGLVFPLIVSWAAIQTARTRSMESATGLLYINVGTIASGTILAAGLYFGAGLLV